MAKKSLSVGKGGNPKTKPASLKIQFNELLDRVPVLVWQGQHAQAIELATRELSKSDWQYALLDLRTESYNAQGKLDIATKDTNAISGTWRRRGS